MIESPKLGQCSESSETKEGQDGYAFVTEWSGRRESEEIVRARVC